MCACLVSIVMEEEDGFQRLVLSCKDGHRYRCSAKFESLDSKNLSRVGTGRCCSVLSEGGVFPVVDFLAWDSGDDCGGDRFNISS